MSDVRTAERPDDVTEASRKRFARRQWARRWLAWRRVLAIAVALLVVVGTVWLFFFSTTLSVEGVDVEGTKVLSDEQVVAAAGVPTGQALARVDLAAIRDRIEALAPVASVDVSRQWPDEILIRVEERTAVAAVEIDGTLRGMDASGVVFRDFARRPARLPLVKVPGGIRDEALVEGAAVVGALPFRLARKVEYVEVRTVDAISLHLRDGRLVKWGSAGRSADKAEVLDSLLQRPGQTYDVSVPGQPTATR